MRSNTLIPAIKALCAKNTCHAAVHLGTSVTYFMHVACGMLHTGILPNSATYTHQQGPTDICSHITTELTTNRCILIGYFNL